MRPLNRKKITSTCNEQRGVCGADSSEMKQPKPIELYTFIDPLCPQCWSLEPIFKKLQVEYGSYFRVRTLVAGRLQLISKTNGIKRRKKRISYLESKMPCDSDIWLEKTLDSSYLPAIAIKAAELQGPQAGARFLRKLRERFFLHNENITDKDVILKCATLASLDGAEFEKDLYSESAKKALRCDMKLTNEMDVDVVPTFVFFNDNIEDEGIKVSGHYPYYVYVQILEEMLGFTPIPQAPKSLEQFLSDYEFVATVEVASVFDITEEEAERRLKELVLQQKVESVRIKCGDFWRYMK